MRIRDIILRGLRSAQPLATAVDVGTLYYVTDESIIERSNGTVWQIYSGASAAGITQLTGDVTAGSGSGSQVATIANDAVTTAKIINDAITTLKILNDAITTAKLVNDAVTTAKILDANITAAKIATDAVITAKIANDAVTYAKIQNVTTARLLGRATAGSGDVEEIILGTNLSLTGTTLDAAGGGGGGAAGWTHIATHTLSGAVSEVDFINLSTYNQLLVVIRLLTSGGNTLRYLRVSTDNGATFLSTSGDYKIVDNGGSESNDTELRFTGSVNSAGVSGWITIDNFNSIFPKTTMCPNLGNANNGIRIIPTTSPLNAIRVFPSSGTINAGNIYVFGKV